jgi:hypothetical protein
LSFDDGADFGVGAVDGFGGGNDFDGLGGAADLKARVDGAGFAVLQIDAIRGAGLKSWLADVQVVGAHCKGGDLIAPAIVGYGGTPQACVRGPQFHGCAGDEGAGGIGYCAIDGCAVLCQQWECNQAKT